MSEIDGMLTKARKKACETLLERRNYQYMNLGCNPDFPPDYWLHHTIEEMAAAAKDRKPLIGLLG